MDVCTEYKNTDICSLKNISDVLEEEEEEKLNLLRDDDSDPNVWMRHREPAEIWVFKSS